MTASVPRILSPDSPKQNPNTKVVGWHYDYLLRAGALADGATSKVLDLQIQPGSPFCLRAIGGYDVEQDERAGPAVSPLTGGFIEFTDSQDQWLATHEIGISGDWPTGGLNTLYEPVYQQIVYGPASVISVRLTNSSGADWADPRIVFRGTHLYYKDRIYAPTYPKCYTAFPYEFPVTFNITPSGANQTFRDLPLSIAANAPKGVTGADFVFRGGVLSLVSGSMADLEFTIRDQAGRPYSNDYIHHNWLFSTNLAERPGIFYPEIYLPKDRILLFDLFQGENAAFNVQLSAMGVRVFPSK